MWKDLMEAVLAFVSFVFFPFAVLMAAAGVLMLLDRLSEIHNHHHHHT